MNLGKKKISYLALIYTLSSSVHFDITEIGDPPTYTLSINSNARKYSQEKPQTSSCCLQVERVLY